ncbi:MAG: DEAD/DEAH box helicase [Planctomycetota bacterium]|nr:MAG: DEAD/DEAH box helicase [Planctomycetota bacterium]
MGVRLPGVEGVVCRPLPIVVVFSSQTESTHRLTGCARQNQEGTRVSLESGRGARDNRPSRGRPPADWSPEQWATQNCGSPAEANQDGQNPVASQPAAVAGDFAKLGLAPETLAAVERAGYTVPTPVQAGFIPRALAGCDVMGQARTGTGKTAAFVLPILERVSKPSPRDVVGPRALVLVPTRELAVQVRDEFEKLAHGSQIHCVAVYGGKPIRAQIEKLAKHPAVVVGTPGRVLDHMSRGTIHFGGLEIVTLDEADRMLDIGFRPDIEKILRRCPDSRQTLLLSATVPPPVAKLATRYMRDPEILDFSTREMTVETIEQFYFTVDPIRKFDLLERLLDRENPRQVIVFCRTKRGTDKVFERLSRRRSRHGGEEQVACIHGDLAQNVRDRVMKQFREGLVTTLVATDVVGRGIDVTSLSHIVNYDIPEFCDDYVHRVGRTGRMGREGVAYTFVAPEEGPQLTRIEMRIEKLLKRDEIEGFEAFDRRPKPAPIQQTGPGGRLMTSEGSAPEGDEAAAMPQEEPQLPKKPSSAALLGKGRGPKRHRRAL